MIPILQTPDSPVLRHRAKEYFLSVFRERAAQIDRMMLWLLAAEWLGMVVTALVLTPHNWNGDQSSIHPHVWAALLAGPAFIVPSIFTALMYPARAVTRHVLAAAQIMVSVLLIGITGGRIETHFQIFGILAFLAFYRDWQVLATASVLTAIDHIVRGIWLPQSVYGVLTVSPWRWVEHAWWVLFEDCFLIIAIQAGIREMWAAAVNKAQLYEGAYHDVLTGLGNRRLLHDRFENLLHAGANSGMAVLFVDLDRFKHANDTLGHTIGDQLLTLVAGRLAEVVTGGNTLARIGGDEFVVLLNEVAGQEDANEAGLQILGALTNTFKVEGHELMLSASVGISLYPDHGTDLATLQERADRAMYVAKSRGRNQCATFSSEVARREKALQEITRDLYKALPNGEFQLHFQPLVQRDAQLVGFEALLRWTHPIHGPIPPAEFIPLAEKSGFIINLGDWILAEACRHCKTWQQKGRSPVGLAVNISAVQFEQADFPDKITAILRETGMDPALLTLELTESVLVRDLPRARRHLSGLRASGIRIALDDFGTGYSSLSYLTSLPADTIKLDRSFLNREFANASAVIESIIDLAHRLGLRVVGEGVETRTQGDRLLDMNCDEFQGFFFSPPVAADAVQGLLESRRVECVDEVQMICQ